MVFKIIRYLLLVFTLIISYSHVNHGQTNDIIGSTGKYIKSNGYFFDEKAINKIFEAGINSMNNFSEDLLIKYESKSNNGVIKVEIIDNGSTKILSLKNNNRLKGITKNLNTIVKVIEEQNINSQDIELLKYMVANAILAEVDEYSSLILPDEMEEFMVETKGTFGGLGIVIGVRKNKLTVISPIEDTPASKVGIKANDIIKGIDSVDADGLSLNQAIKLLRGEKGTSVTLYVEREGVNDLIKFKIIRDIIKVKSVTSKKIDDIGYIKINSFQINSYKDFVKNLDELRLVGIKGLILDLRGNPGGLLDQAIKISNVLLKNKLIVSTRGKDSRMDMDFFTQTGGTSKYFGPLIVLIDSGSASASEIVAGALKNNQRAIIIGENSFGKGTVQEVYQQNDGSAIKLTIAEYLNPNEYKVHKNGVKPDIEFISVKVENNEIFFMEKFEEQLNYSENYKIFSVETDSDTSKEIKIEEDKKIILSKKILESNFINKISFNENIKNFLVISEDLLKNEAEKYLRNFFDKIDKYENDSYEEVINNIEFTNNDKRLLNSGAKEEIVFNIDNKNSNKIKNVFIKLTSDNKTLNNRFYFIDDIKKFENKTVKIELKIPEWVESGNEKINFSLVKINFNNILKPMLMELGNEMLNLEIKKSNYKFPELFYNIDLDPKQKEIVISFDLKKTGQKCDECYLKIFSRDKNLSISQRNIQIENLSDENYNGVSKIKIREKNISKQIKFTVRFHDEKTNDYFDKDIEINKSELLSYVKNEQPKSFIIKKRDIIYSEPSYSETILSNLKEGNLVYSNGNTDNFILVKQSDNNFWIPKDAVEEISAEEEPNFIKAKISKKSDIPPEIKLINNSKEGLIYEIKDKSKLKIINYYINDKKIGVKETNLISEKIYIDSKLDIGRNKISIIAIDKNDFKTAKNFYITRDET
ncbi:PDZ domain-containing protein [bacterium]|nr:PDZ domain-containing protein [bacterium]